MRIIAFSLILAATSAIAAETSDEDALSIADKAPSSTEHAGNWHSFIEGAIGQIGQRTGNQYLETQRLSLDIAYDAFIAPKWRAVFADRLDMFGQDQTEGRRNINTLKEAYLNWHASQDQLFDLGRINARYGVGTGYNPTDFFRGGALRSVTSADPNSLRKNRLGSVMLRSQTLWTQGSLTALYSPKLDSEQSNTPFNADLGATNDRNRWLLSLSHQFSENINPQWSLYGEEHGSPQLGFNLSSLLNDATVGYIEWSGGRSRSLLSQALNGSDDTAFRSRLSTGITYTTENKITLTLEAQHSNAGLGNAEWDALGRGPRPTYQLYRKFANDRQDLPTKREVFLYATWDDALINNLSINALARLNLSDYSRMTWLESRYHLDHADLALQWQMNTGSATSAYGAATQQRILQGVVTYFF